MCLASVEVLIQVVSLLWTTRKKVSASGSPTRLAWAGRGRKTLTWPCAGCWLRCKECVSPGGSRWNGSEARACGPGARWNWDRIEWLKAGWPQRSANEQNLIFQGGKNWLSSDWKIISCWQIGRTVFKLINFFWGNSPHFYTMHFSLILLSCIWEIFIAGISKF